MILIVFGLVFAALLLAAKTIVTTEYPYWGGALAAGLLRMAARWNPFTDGAQLDEWLGELDELQRNQNHAGVLFASSLLGAAAKARLRHPGRRVRRARWVKVGRLEVDTESTRTDLAAKLIGLLSDKQRELALQIIGEMSGEKVQPINSSARSAPITLDHDDP